MYTRFLRDAAAGTGGGGLQGLVEGLTNLPDDKLEDDNPDAGTGDDAAKAAEQTAIKAEAFENDGITLKPGYLKADDGTISKDPNYTAPVPDTEEGLDKDGNLLPGFKKDDNGKVVPDPDYKETELTDEEQVREFFERVNAITGDPVEIEYPEGVDPLSPEGIAHYTNVIREDAAIMFEEHLKAKDPRGYAYLLHRAAGKPDSEFLNSNAGFVLPKQEEFDASADMQAAVLKYSMKVQGLDDDSIDVLVKKAIADNKLKERSDAAYKAIDEAQKRELDNIAKDTEKREAENDAAIAGFLGKVDKVIAGDMKFIVGDAEKPGFKKFVIDSLRYDENDKTFALVQKIPDDQLIVVLESLFFQHKKGNLKALVERDAKTKAAQNLRLKVNAKSGGPGSGQSSTKSDDQFIPLSAMTVQS